MTGANLVDGVNEAILGPPTDGDDGSIGSQRLGTSPPDTRATTRDQYPHATKRSVSHASSSSSASSGGASRSRIPG